MFSFCNKNDLSSSNQYSFKPTDLYIDNWKSNFWGKNYEISGMFWNISNVFDKIY